MKININIGPLLREIRIGRNISQHELAKKTDLTQQRISQMELGIRAVTLDNLIIISCVLNVCPKIFVRCENYLHVNCRICKIVCNKCIYSNIKNES